MANDIFKLLEQRLIERKSADAEGSYVADLYRRGDDRILQKIGEEAVELIIAAKGKSEQEIINEAADLWFHTMVLFAHKNIAIDKIGAVLKARFGVSGLAEKSRRGEDL